MTTVHAAQRDVVRDEHIFWEVVVLTNERVGELRESLGESERRSLDVNACSVLSERLDPRR